MSITPINFILTPQGTKTSSTTPKEIDLSNLSPQEKESFLLARISELRSQTEAVSPLTDNLLAHWFGHQYINEGPLSGNKTPNILKDVLPVLQQFNEQNLHAELSELNHIANLTLEQQIHLALSRISTLKSGESFLFPCGNAAHAMLGKITLKNHKYIFSVYNTGSGQQFHMLEKMQNGEFGYLELKCDNANIESLKSNVFWEYLFNLRFTKIEDKAPFSIWCFYDGILPAVGTFYPNRNSPKTRQLSGICSRKVITEYIKHQSPNAAAILAQIHFNLIVRYVAQDKLNPHILTWMLNKIGWDIKNTQHSNAKLLDYWVLQYFIKTTLSNLNLTASTLLNITEDTGIFKYTPIEKLRLLDTVEIPYLPDYNSENITAYFSANLNFLTKAKEALLKDDFCTLALSISQSMIKKLPLPPLHGQTWIPGLNSETTDTAFNIFKILSDLSPPPSSSIENCGYNAWLFQLDYWSSLVVHYWGSEIRKDKPDVGFFELLNNYKYKPSDPELINIQIHLQKRKIQHNVQKLVSMDQEKTRSSFTLGLTPKTPLEKFYSSTTNDLKIFDRIFRAPNDNFNIPIKRTVECFFRLLTTNQRKATCTLTSTYFSVYFPKEDLDPTQTFDFHRATTESSATLLSLWAKGHTKKILYANPQGTNIILTGIDPKLNRYEAYNTLSAAANITTLLMHYKNNPSLLRNSEHAELLRVKLRDNLSSQQFYCDASSTTSFTLNIEQNATEAFTSLYHDSLQEEYLLEIIPDLAEFILITQNFHSNAKLTNLLELCLTQSVTHIFNPSMAQTFIRILNRKQIFTPEEEFNYVTAALVLIKTNSYKQTYYSTLPKLATFFTKNDPHFWSSAIQQVFQKQLIKMQWPILTSEDMRIDLVTQKYSPLYVTDFSILSIKEILQPLGLWNPQYKIEGGRHIISDKIFVENAIYYRYNDEDYILTHSIAHYLYWCCANGKNIITFKEEVIAVGNDFTSVTRSDFMLTCNNSINDFCKRSHLEGAHVYLDKERNIQYVHFAQFKELLFYIHENTIESIEFPGFFVMENSCTNYCPHLLLENVEGVKKLILCKYATTQSFLNTFHPINQKLVKSKTWDVYHIFDYNSILTKWIAKDLQQHLLLCQYYLSQNNIQKALQELDCCYTNYTLNDADLEYIGELAKMYYCEGVSIHNDPYYNLFFAKLTFIFFRLNPVHNSSISICDSKRNAIIALINQLHTHTKKDFELRSNKLPLELLIKNRPEFLPSSLPTLLFYISKAYKKSNLTFNPHPSTFEFLPIKNLSKNLTALTPLQVAAFDNKVMHHQDPNIRLRARISLCIYTNTINDLFSMRKSFLDPVSSCELPYTPVSTRSFPDKVLLNLTIPPHEPKTYTSLDERKKQILFYQNEIPLLINELNHSFPSSADLLLDIQQKRFPVELNFEKLVLNISRGYFYPLNSWDNFRTMEYHQKTLEILIKCYEYNSLKKSTLIEEGLLIKDSFEEMETLPTPELYAFAFLNDLLIRKKNFELAQIALDPSHSHSFFELIMGAGKTSVGIPLVAALAANQGYLPVIVVSKSQVNEVFKILSEKIMSNMKREVFRFSCNRNLIMSHYVPGKVAFEELIAILKKVQSNHGVILMTPEDLQNFKLLTLEFVHDEECSTLLSTINTLLREKGFGIVDEAPENLGLETNFPTGKHHTLTDRQIKLIQFLQNLTQNLISPLDPNEYTMNVKPTLIHKFIASCPFTYLQADQLHAFFANQPEGEAAVDALFITHPEEARELSLVKLMLDSILSFTHSRSHNLHYGHPIEGIHSVPYVGSKKPSPSTKYSHPLVEASFTVLSYQIAGIPLNHLKTFLVEKLQNLKHKSRQLNVPIQELKGWQKIQLLTGSSILELLKDESKLVNTTKKPELVQAFLKQALSKIKWQELMRRADGFDIAETIFQKVIAMTGTSVDMRLHSRALQNNFYKDTLFEETIQQVMAHPKNQQIKQFERTSTPRDILSQLPIIPNMIVDPDAQFKDYSSQEMVDEIFAAYPYLANVVAFNNEDDTLQLWQRGAKPLAINWEEASARNALVYLSQVYYLGANPIMPHDAQAVVFSGPNTCIYQYHQAIARLRLLTTTNQSFVTLIPSGWTEPSIASITQAMQQTQANATETKLIINCVKRLFLPLRALQQKNPKEHIDLLTEKVVFDPYLDRTTPPPIHKSEFLQKIRDQIVKQCQDLNIPVPQACLDELVHSATILPEMIKLNTNELNREVAEEKEEEQQKIISNADFEDGTLSPELRKQDLFYKLKIDEKSLIFPLNYHLEKLGLPAVFSPKLRISKYLANAPFLPNALCILECTFSSGGDYICLIAPEQIEICNRISTPNNLRISDAEGNYISGNETLNIPDRNLLLAQIHFFNQSYFLPENLSGHLTNWMQTCWQECSTLYDYFKKTRPVQKHNGKIRQLLRFSKQNPLKTGHTQPATTTTTIRKKSRRTTK